MDNYWIRIYLIRHGHVNYFDENHQPVNPKYAALSELGIQQIQAVADLVQDIREQATPQVPIPEVKPEPVTE